jgi:exosome complex component RRP42
VIKMISIDPSLIKQMADSGKRIDNRAHDQYRETSIETNVVSSAEGSARVRLGNTEVVAGIKIGVGEPFSDTPNEGVLMVGAEFLPLASPEFENGPPGEDAIELARVVDRAIRESKMIDMEKLCITPGEKVWMVYVDIDILDDDGNLIDASSLATIAALLKARLPKLDPEGKIEFGVKSEQGLPIKGRALSTTFVKIGNSIFVDPSLSEVEALDSRLTVGTFDQDGKTMISSIQKGGTCGFTVEEIDTIIGLAVKKGDELRALL